MYAAARSAEKTFNMRTKKSLLTDIIVKHVGVIPYFAANSEGFEGVG